MIPTDVFNGRPGSMPLEHVRGMLAGGFAAHHGYTWEDGQRVPLTLYDLDFSWVRAGRTKPSRTSSRQAAEAMEKTPLCKARVLAETAKGMPAESIPAIVKEIVALLPMALERRWRRRAARPLRDRTIERRLKRVGVWGGKQCGKAAQ